MRTCAPAGSSAATLGPVLGEGSRLPESCPPRRVELLLEVFTAALPPIPVTLPPIPVALDPRQLLAQSCDLSLLFLNAGIAGILLRPGTLPWHPTVMPDPLEKYKSKMLDLARHETTPLNKYHEGDCNEILLNKVFPRCRWDDYRRALCLLDPYGLAVDWKVLRTAGEMKSIEIFYNFMIMDANMNVFMRDPGKVMLAQAHRMDAVWGDNSWRSTAYTTTEDLFGTIERKTTNEDIAEAFRLRLEQIASFAYVPPPMPMRNSKGAVVYYLYFASQNKTGARIVKDIFDTYGSRGTA